MPIHEKHLMILKCTRERRRRRAPKIRHRNIPPISDTQYPRQEHVGDNNANRRRLDGAEKAVNGSFHIRKGGSQEAGIIFGPDQLGREDVWNTPEPDVFRRGVGSKETVPLFSDDESDEKVGFLHGDDPAEVHQRVDVTSSRERYGDYVPPEFCVAHFCR